jgi:hypothetical protein
VPDYDAHTLTGKRPKVLKIFISAAIVSVAYGGLVGLAAMSFINVLP